MGVVIRATAGPLGLWGGHTGSVVHAEGHAVVYAACINNRSKGTWVGKCHGFLNSNRMNLLCDRLSLSNRNTKSVPICFPYSHLMFFISVSNAFSFEQESVSYLQAVSWLATLHDSHLALTNFPRDEHNSAEVTSGVRASFSFPFQFIRELTSRV